MRPGCFAPTAIAVIDSEDVFEAMTASSRRIASSLAISSRLTSSFSTMASSTMSQPARSSSAPQGLTRASVASASAALILPLSASLASVSCRYWRAAATACGLASYRLTVRPAWAAICAMPRPMAPVPTTPSVSMVKVLIIRPKSCG
ncbi:hypothetical protein D9M72_566190 [compost metagenome]